MGAASSHGITPTIIIIEGAEQGVAIWFFNTGMVTVLVTFACRWCETGSTNVPIIALALSVSLGAVHVILARQ
jgi:hypothetical protein